MPRTPAQPPAPPHPPASAIGLDGAPHRGELRSTPRVATPAAPPPTWLLVAAFLSLYIFWGSTYLGIKWAVQQGGAGVQPVRGFPPFFLAGIRSVIAGAIVYAFVRIVQKQPRPAMRHWRNTTVIGVLLLLGGNGLVTFATQYIPSGVVALLIAMLPIWMLLLEGPWGGPPLRERARPSVFLGIGLGIAGVAMLVWPKIAAAIADRAAGNGHNHVMEAVGVCAVMLSSFLWANGSLFSRRVGGRPGALPRSPFLTTGMQLLCGGGALLVVSVLAGEMNRLTVDAAFADARPALALAYLVVFGSLVGYTAYIWLLGVSTPAKIATYAYVNPIVAIVLAALLGNETLTLRTFVAAAVIIAGVVVIVTFRPAKAAIAPEEAS